MGWEEEVENYKMTNCLEALEWKRRKNGPKVGPIDLILETKSYKLGLPEMSNISLMC